MVSILRNAFSVFTNSLLKISSAPKTLNVQPLIVPNRAIGQYIDARMARDVKRRKVIKEYGKLRLQMNSLRKNTILPTKLREVAHKELDELPRDSCIIRIHARCVLTSRARGRWRDFRMSRIIWRHLADYNQISGAERAMWGFTP